MSHAISPLGIDLLVMVDTESDSVGFEPGGATGDHDTDWPSLEIARIPSCFL